MLVQDEGQRFSGHLQGVLVPVFSCRSSRNIDRTKITFKGSTNKNNSPAATTDDEDDDDIDDEGDNGDAGNGKDCDHDDDDGDDVVSWKWQMLPTVRIAMTKAMMTKVMMQVMIMKVMMTLVSSALRCSSAFNF